MTNLGTAKNSGRPASGEPAGKHDPVPAVFDWILGLLAGLTGAVTTVVGVVQYLEIDREAIAADVGSESVEPGGLTRTEVVEAAVPFVDWLAVGTAVTGLLLIAAAVWFVSLRRRTRRRVDAAGGTTATFWSCVVYGGAAGMVTPVPGVSLLVSGGVAAALSDTERCASIGALAALFGTALSVPLLLSLGAGILAGGAAIGELAGGVFLLGLLTIGLIVWLAVNAGLGALGGVVGDRLV